MIQGVLKVAAGAGLALGLPPVALGVLVLQRFSVLLVDCFSGVLGCQAPA